MDKGKERELSVLRYYPHRIIQWAIILQIQDILESTFINRTYASLPKRGIHQALNKLSCDLEDEENTRYCYKIDIKKFYPSIDRVILKSMLRKKFKDKKLLWLIDMIVDSVHGTKGVPIGSLLSQWLGNYYLTYFDHYVKEELKINYYHRYCDDVV